MYILESWRERCLETEAACSSWRAVGLFPSGAFLLSSHWERSLLECHCLKERAGNKNIFPKKGFPWIPKGVQIVHIGFLTVSWQANLREGTALLWYLVIYSFTVQLCGPEQIMSHSHIQHLGNCVNDRRGAPEDYMSCVVLTEAPGSGGRAVKNAPSLGIKHTIHPPFYNVSWWQWGVTFLSAFLLGWDEPCCALAQSQRREGQGWHQQEGLKRNGFGQRLQ